MAKITKTQPTPAAAPVAQAPAPKPSASSAPVKDIIDISKLTPEQLAALQKQLKATKKVDSGKAKERFAIIDTMLQEKDEDNGGFKHTTRDILNRLVKEELIKPAGSEDEQNEIKKIQARKQFLEKKRDEKGELVYPDGTFGYKPSSALGFQMTAAKCVEWFTPEHVATMTDAQKDTVIRALSAKK